MTENEWIFHLSKYLSTESPIVASYNEDCAVITLETGEFLLLTTDAMVERVHFDLAYTEYYALGYKLASINLSDIASMGGLPLYALLTIGCPTPPDSIWIDPLMEGLVSQLHKYGVKLVGGDTVRADQLILNLCVIGKTERPLLRSGAKPGDLIYVSRPLGQSSAFLKFLKKENFDQIPDELKRSHFYPEPEVILGRAIKDFATSAIDISDGLLLDLFRLCVASCVSAHIFEEAIPVGNFASLEDALSGGEDYALLFTLNEKDTNKLEEISGKLQRTFFPIGKIYEGNGEIILIGREGERRLLSPSGYDHFTFQPLL